jgi:hypothetical protein
VNGDGKADLITPSLAYHAVSVLQGNGDGTFRPAQTFAVGGGPFGVAAADLNSDGKLDLVAVSPNYPNLGILSVLLGNGDGTFKAPVTYPLGSTPEFLALADLNGDGRIDIVVSNRDSGTVSVLLGNGDGTFQPQTTWIAGPDPYSVAVADVNGDGKPDLVVANGSDVSVLLGNGNGTFQLRRTWAAGFFPVSVAVADVNSDGRPDLVVANDAAPTGDVRVLLGNGNGTFQPQQIQILPAQSHPLSVAVADVNGDGKPDLIASNSGYLSASASVLLGNGDGTFQPQQAFRTSNRAQPVYVSVSDVNGDGKPDIIAANTYESSVAVLRGNVDGAFAGQLYTILSPTDTLNGGAGNDSILLVKDANGTDIDWTLDSSSGQLPINDPNGLTINGNGGNDTITLDYTTGNPLPNIVHLYSGTGNFTINGLQGTNPLAGTALDMGRSTVFISYSSSDPIAAIQGYLRNGYNAGAWNGSPTATTGVIASAAAQANPNHNTAIGYADWADGQGVNTSPNTIELKYTLYGDANLDAQVNSADLQHLLASFNTPGAWDGGDFNYDGIVNSADLQALLATFNTQLGSQATPMAIAATPAATTTAKTTTSSDPSSQLLPAIQPTGSTNPVVHHPHSRPRRLSGSGDERLVHPSEGLMAQWA